MTRKEFSAEIERVNLTIRAHGIPDWERYVAHMGEVIDRAFDGLARGGEWDRRYMILKQYLQTPKEELVREVQKRR